MTSSSPWRTTSTREIYENPWIRLREDEVIRPDGQPGVYGVVEMKNPSVFVVALTDNEEVLMVSLFRYATAAPSLEVPAGGCDGQEPLIAARRELLEETGYEASVWKEIGRMNALNGVCSAPEHVFLASGLYRSREETNHGIETEKEQVIEGIDTVHAVTWPVLMQLVAGGKIADGETVAALMFAALELGKL